jgi:proton glutamate symport protein
LGRDPAQLAELLASLGGYMLTVVVALVVHLLLVYSVLLKVFTRVPWRRFARALLPAQMLAFSSSSSAATLPVTIQCVEEGIGVDEEVSSFVLPLGATINMDGTGLYQGVAAVFIANALGLDLSLAQQLQIVLTAALASIGTAAVPGVGIVMLVIVLRQVGIPEAGIGLILAVDRPLDMCRTVLNVTGDATVATVVASTEGLLHEPDGAA